MANLFLQKRLKKIFSIPLARLGLLISGTLFLTLILHYIDLSVIEAPLYDLRMILGFDTNPDPAFVIVKIDEETSKTLDEYPPLQLSHHALFLEALADYNPKAVGYVVNFRHVQQADPSQFEKGWGSRFVAAARSFERMNVPFLIGTPFDVTGEILPPFPLSLLSHSVGIIHKDGNLFSEDKTSRRALVTLYNRPSFHLDLVRRILSAQEESHKNPDSFVPTGTYAVPVIEGSHTLIRFPFQNNRRYTEVSFKDVLNRSLPQEMLNQKIILVGTTIKENPGDFTVTPFAKFQGRIPKLQVHAATLDSFINHKNLILIPPWLSGILAFIAINLVCLWAFLFNPLKGLIATLSLGAGLVFFSYLVFQGIFTPYGFWLELASPLLGLFVSYYLVVPYRLIREYQMRYDYEKRNELLQQVEEMKTNFIHLVTHDLKTPVARIQGLTEVLQKKAAERLVERDKEALHSIVESTEELNHFINSILELSKIDSNQLQIRFESKDINQLIERAIEKFKPFAKSRGIKIQAQLEPLFPVKIDPILLSKVINNLIDNAIKYSPENSQIQIFSREIFPHIEVTVIDQGIGMTQEEQDNLFTRFFRAKNDQTTSISGTGLGLYLTKYFIEAQKGKILVKSEKGKGSQFTIQLPIE